MLIKLKEAQKIDGAQLDEHGRMVAKSSFVYRDIFINPEHIVSINQEENKGKEPLSRIETTRGIFTVVGTPAEIQSQLTGTKNTKVLRD